MVDFLKNILSKGQPVTNEIKDKFFGALYYQVSTVGNYAMSRSTAEIDGNNILLDVSKTEQRHYKTLYSELQNMFPGSLELLDEYIVIKDAAKLVPQMEKMREASAEIAANIYPRVENNFSGEEKVIMRDTVTISPPRLSNEKILLSTEMSDGYNFRSATSTKCTISPLPSGNVRISLDSNATMPFSEAAHAIFGKGFKLENVSHINQQEGTDKATSVGYMKKADFIAAFPEAQKSIEAFSSRIR